MSQQRKSPMTLVDSVEAGRLTISELIDPWRKIKITQLPDGISDTVHFDFATANLNFCWACNRWSGQKLWYERDNGIASIRQGVPSLQNISKACHCLEN